MIVFPGSKINLGLYIERCRPDGYHDISTVLYPIGWSDVLEMVPAEGGETTLHCMGRPVDCPPEKNLVMKAFRALEQETGPLPATDIYLQKTVPDGAGLGGGSADAAATIKALNELYTLGLSDELMSRVAARVGADCPFFIYNRPILATGTGTDLQPAEVDLSGYKLLVAKPQGCSVSTAAAYGSVSPGGSAPDILEILGGGVGSWRGRLRNDFEPGVFALSPAIGEVKEQMYSHGAVYAAMSGSGAAVFGLFAAGDDLRVLTERLRQCDVYVE